jgi:hypothetical protein
MENVAVREGCDGGWERHREKEKREFRREDWRDGSGGTKKRGGEKYNSKGLGIQLAWSL